MIHHISHGVDPRDTDKVKAAPDRRGLIPRPDEQGENFKRCHVLDPGGWVPPINHQPTVG